MNFESITRFRFEPIQKKKKATDEMIRILPTRVHITKALYERMGEPEFVSIGYDKEEKALGVKVTDENDPTGVAITTEGKTPVCKASKYISDFFAEILKVDLQEIGIYYTHGKKIGDYYVFEDRYIEKAKKYRRDNGTRRNDDSAL